MKEGYPSSIGGSYEVLQQAEQEAQQAFERWAPSHAEGPLCVLPYDLDQFPEQRLDVLWVEADPDLNLARYAGEYGMGAEAHARLVNNFKWLNTIPDIELNANQGVSTLIATAHLENILDTAIAHNAIFVASGKNSFAQKNIIVANPMMKRLGFQINGEVISVTDILCKSGRVIFALPNAALEHGISEETLGSYNRAFAPIFTEMTNEGAAIHWALSGTRAKEIKLSTGHPAKMMPKVDESVARIARKRTPNALGVVMNLSPQGSYSRVLRTRELRTSENVHELMSEIADGTSEITGSKVTYGLPKGAVLL